MKARLYLETTIPSYYVARPSKDSVTAARQKVTHRWWTKRLADFDVFVSETVLAEAAAGDSAMARQRLELLKPFALLPTTDEVIFLADALIRGGPLPAKAARDAAHIAAATVHGLHFLLTWNCRHIANAEMLRQIERVCESHGYRCPVVCTPDELMGL